MRSKRQNSYSNAEKAWTLLDALPGEPDKDYPILSEIPKTDFSCLEKSEGYYADTETRCQVFRVCANTADDTSKGFGFLCPNGTLFNQEYFVCDWYMNVDCANSEQYYGLNEQIGNGLSMNDFMNQAKEMVSFPRKLTNRNGANNNNNARKQGTNRTPPSKSIQLPANPTRGSANLGEPTNANYPYSSTSGNGNGLSPQRGTSGGVIYVNSLGQLSTDKDSGFDERNSFILRTDKDSTFDQDFRIPSNSFDTLKGIGNSYSFGIPGSVPMRGSEDLSEPVDPAELKNDRYLPPSSSYVKNVPKQIYTYPNDANRRPTFNPEHTGQINSKLAANSPKFQPPQVYGPAITGFPGSNSEQRPPQIAKPKNVAQQSPLKLYQAPRAPQMAQPQQFRSRAAAAPKQQQQQKQNIERRNFNAAPAQPQQHYHQQQQKGRPAVSQAQIQANSRSSPVSNQSNEGFLRHLFKDVTHIHNDKSKLVELIQRLFVSPSTNARVVSADVYPSQASESYVFTYPDDHAASENRNSQARSHPGNCGGHHH